MNVRKPAILFCRVVQAALVIMTALLILGGLSQNILAFMALTVFGLVLLAFAGVTEGVVRLIRRGATSEQGETA